MSRISSDLIEKNIPKIFDTAERTVTYFRASKVTSNITGSEELNYDTGNTKKIIFIRGDRRKEYGMEGLLEKADGIVIARTSVGISKDDKFTIGSESFIIQVVEKAEYSDTNYFDKGIVTKVV